MNSIEGKAAVASDSLVQDMNQEAEKMLCADSAVGNHDMACKANKPDWCITRDFLWEIAVEIWISSNPPPRIRMVGACMSSCVSDSHKCTARLDNAC